MSVEYPKWDIIEFAGINENLANHLITDSQAEDAQNVLSPITGRLQKRPGQAYLVSTAIGTGVLGLHPYYYGDPVISRKLLAVFNDGTMYRLNSGAWTATDKTGLDTTSQVLFATCVNYCVGMNGHDAPFKYDGLNATPLANAPATGRCPVLHYEQLFCIVDADSIRWSDTFAPETWPGVNQADFDRGDGDELSGLFEYGSNLLVCKKQSIYKLSGMLTATMDSLSQKKVENNYGVAGPRAGVVVEPYFYYISKDGIFRFNDMSSTNIIDPPGTTSGMPITWAGVNKQALSGAVAGYNKTYNCLWFHVPYGANQTTNNLVLVYDLSTGCWWKFTAIEASCMAEWNDGTSIYLLTGSPTTGHVIKQNTGLNDLGVAISAYWKGKNYCADFPTRVKKSRKVFAADVKSLNDAVFTYRVNSAAAWTSPTAATDKDDVRKYRVKDKFRYFQPKFTHSVLDQDFALTGMRLVFKPGKDK